MKTKRLRGLKDLCYAERLQCLKSVFGKDMNNSLESCFFLTHGISCYV